VRDESEENYEKPVTTAGGLVKVQTKYLSNVSIATAPLLLQLWLLMF
jgi:hypothetical protein